MPKFCTSPFTMLDIKEDGSCSVCCEQWLPYKIGNLYQNSLHEVWNGPPVRILRESMLDQSFRFCNSIQCPELSSNMLPIITETTDEQKTQILDRNLPADTDIKIIYFDPNNSHANIYGDDFLLRQIKNKYPSQVNLTYDRSCNLQCPSCRKEVINVTEGEEYNKLKMLHNNIINSLFDKPHDNEIILNITSSGDPFASKIYRDFLFNFDPSPWPNLKIGLQTHGGLLTPSNWSRISQWHDRIAYVKICFDAAKKETYEIVRKRGNWDQLMANCEFINQHLTTGFGIADFIVQDLNYREIPDFTKMILSKFDKFDYIAFYLVNNWGTWSNEEFERHAIWKPTHPCHSDLKKILQDPILSHPKVRLGSLERIATTFER